MFLFSVTPRSLTSLPPDLSARSFDCAHGGGCCTVATGGLLLDSVEATDARVVITEALPAKSGAPRAALLRLKFDPRACSGTLERIGNSGRPLYYHIGDDGSFYASTNLRFLQQVGVKFDEDLHRLPELLMYRMVICPQTLVRGVRQLCAGETIEFQKQNGKFVVRTLAIFNPPHAEEVFDEARLVRLSREFLEEIFLATNPEPGRFGSLLSGGLDSTLLTKLAFDLFGTKESFSCSYPFESIEEDMELSYAESAAHNVGTKHLVYVPTMAQYLHGVIDTIYHAEQPMMHLQSVLLHLIYKHELAPRGYNIVANGEGADGIFGLKTHRFINYLTEHPAQRMALGIPPFTAALRAVSTMTNRFGLIARMAGAKIDPNTPLSDPRHIVWSDAIFGYWPWIKRYTHASAADVIRGRADAMSAYQSRDLLEQVSITAFLGEGTQTQLIWSTIADPVGIGVFYPFPNSKLVDAAYRAPWSYKLGEPKKALRDVCRKLGIAEFIITRPKAAFGIRSERYGPRGSVFEPLIAVAAKGVDEPTLRGMQSPEIYKAQTLFSLLNLGIWRRLFIHRESLDALHEEIDIEMRRLGVLDTFNKPGRVAPMIS